MEDSELISNTDELEFNHLQSSGFPSPSYKMVSWLGFEHKFPRPEIALEATDLEDFDTDGPLFWPFERKFDWNSKETLRFFTMSPRKNIKIFPTSTPDRNLRNSELSLHQMKRPFFKLGAVASNKIMERRRRNDNTTYSPSRFSGATNNSSAKVVALETNNENVVEYPTRGKGSDNYFLGESFGSKEELPIEMLLGLDEFDGHEGVDSQFNEDDFSLDESLY